MNCKLEKTSIVFHQDSDMICIAAQADAGLVLHPVHAQALTALTSWIAEEQAYEPKLYRIIMGAWRWVKKHALRRPVSQGKYERVVLGKGDDYLVLTCEHFAQEPIVYPFLRRKTNA